MELPLCVPSKRARAPNNGNQVASCLVDGCDSDLSKCRDYHRRHKVCDLHSKTPKVTIRGQEQRFCQQCSRFHSLVEFDDVKRSCRKRLDGHNRRRRKPQPDSFLNSTQFLSNFQGPKFVPFTGSQAFPGSALASCSWVSPVKPEHNAEFFSSSHPTSLSFTDRKAPFSVSSPQSFKGHIQFPFLQVTKQESMGGPSIGGPIADPSRSPGINGGCSQELFLGAVSPDRALSLLSSLPQAEASPQKGANCALQLDTSPPHTQSVLQHPHYDRIGLCESEPRALASQEMFQMRHDGPTASSSHPSHHHAPSFCWE